MTDEGKAKELTVALRELYFAAQEAAQCLKTYRQGLRGLLPSAVDLEDSLKHARDTLLSTMQMDATAVMALEKSIEHWRKNAEATCLGEVSVSGEDCALCKQYGDCEGCPVASFTGESQCHRTPYAEARRALLAWRDCPHNKDKRDEFQKAATAELEFLKSLLPR